MSAAPKELAFPLLTITVGLGWLLTVQEVLPGVNWVWVLGLGVVGILVLAIGGIDKVTVVVGPFFILATIFSLLRQTGRLSVDTEVPSMVIVAGVLWLISLVSPVPAPKWLQDPK